MYLGESVAFEKRVEEMEIKMGDDLQDMQPANLRADDWVLHCVTFLEHLIE